MIERPHITRSVPQTTAVVHVTVPRSRIQEVMDPAIQEVLAAVTSQGIGPTGPLVTHHLRTDPETFDFLVGFPVSAPVKAIGRVQPGEIPARSVARTVYHGPYEGLHEAWQEFMDWMKDNNHTPTADLWEVYAVGPETGPDPSTWRTELNRGVER